MSAKGGLLSKADSPPPPMPRKKYRHSCSSSDLLQKEGKWLDQMCWEMIAREKEGRSTDGGEEAGAGAGGGERGARNRPAVPKVERRAASILRGLLTAGVGFLSHVDTSVESRGNL